MPRPRTKNDLTKEAEASFAKLMKLVDTKESK